MQRRAAVVKALADKLADKAERMATAESIDMGKVLESSAGDDLKRQIRNLNYHAEMATHAPGTSSVVETDESYEKRPGESSSKSYVNYVTRYPIGVVAVIGHWSRPLHQLVWRLDCSRGGRIVRPDDASQTLAETGGHGKLRPLCV